MKLRGLLFLVALSSCSSNVVCAELVAVDKDVKCVPIASGLGSDKSTDVALIKYGTGGVKWCKSTLDPTKPIDCGDRSMLLSQEEQQAAQAREAARREATQPTAAPTPAPPASSSPPAPVVDAGTPPAVDAKP